MRYRRYYSRRNSDGSRTVLSVGPIGSAWMKLVELLLAFGLVAWPAIVISDNLHGVVAWVLGIPAELLWLAVLLIVWALLRKQQFH